MPRFVAEGMHIPSLSHAARSQSMPDAQTPRALPKMLPVIPHGRSSSLLAMAVKVARESVNAMNAHAALANSHKTVHDVLEALFEGICVSPSFLDHVSRLRNKIPVGGSDVSFIVRVG